MFNICTLSHLAVIKLVIKSTQTSVSVGWLILSTENDGLSKLSISWLWQVAILVRVNVYKSPLQNLFNLNLIVLGVGLHYKLTKNNTVFEVRDLEQLPLWYMLVKFSGFHKLAFA